MNTTTEAPTGTSEARASDGQASPAPTADPVRKLTETITAEQLEAATRTLTLPEAMRLGATVTERTQGWGYGGSACALSAARIGGNVAGYCG